MARGQLFADQPDHDLVRDQMPFVHHPGHNIAHGGAAGPGLAQHVAGGELHHLPLVNQKAGLGSFARPRRSQQDDVHLRATHLREGPLGRGLVLRLPRNCDFSISPSY